MCHMAPKGLRYQSEAHIPPSVCIADAVPHSTALFQFFHSTCLVSTQDHYAVIQLFNCHAMKTGGD
jgi:hypothetical protein